MYHETFIFVVVIVMAVLSVASIVFCVVHENLNTIKEAKLDKEYEAAFINTNITCIIEERLEINDDKTTKIAYHPYFNAPKINYTKNVIIYEKQSIKAELNRYTNFYDLEDVKKSILLWKEKKSKERVITTHSA